MAVVFWRFIHRINWLSSINDSIASTTLIYAIEIKVENYAQQRSMHTKIVKLFWLKDHRILWMNHNDLFFICWCLYSLKKKSIVAAMSGF